MRSLFFAQDTSVTALEPFTQNNTWLIIVAFLAILAIALFLLSRAAIRNARLAKDMQKLNQETRDLNANIEQTRQQLERLDRVKTDFIMVASHELRTPLSQIRGYTDIIDALNNNGKLDREQLDSMADNLRKATERMEVLISDMLAVSQIDVNAMDLDFTQTTLDQVIRLALEPLIDAARQRKIALTARGLKSLPAIQADSQRLVQAIRNVIVNAIKFTPDGGRIEITGNLKAADNTQDSEAILLAITDTGIGIPPENLTLIFEKFFRGFNPDTHSTGAYKFLGAGPGLGLTIARGVIQAHGGDIWAESSGYDVINLPGSAFYILLPILQPKADKSTKSMVLGESGWDQPTLQRSQLR